MQIIRHLAEVGSISDPELRTLIEKTIADLSQDGPYDPDELGYFLIVQPGDRLDEISDQIGFPIMANRWTGIEYGHAGFTPSFELVEEHAGSYALVFITSDSGYGIEVFVPKAAGIDSDLLTMCQKYATAGAI